MKVVITCLDNDDQLAEIHIEVKINGEWVSTSKVITTDFVGDVDDNTRIVIEKAKED